MAYDHAAHKIRYDRIVETRITDVSYAGGIAGRTMFYGTARQPTDQSNGRYEPGDGSITFQREAWEDYMKRKGTGYLDAVFEIVIERTDSANGRYWKTVLRKCKFMAPDDSSSEGGDPTVTTASFTFMELEENGSKPVK